MKKVLIITNNPKVEILPGAEFHEETLLEILTRVRNMVHSGYILISHPLAGSIKPNETPYKSVILDPTPTEAVDETSLRVIEGSLATAAKLLKDRALKLRSQQIMDDYAVIDLSLIESGLQSLSHL
jgi:hypothetical protein